MQQFVKRALLIFGVLLIWSSYSQGKTCGDFFNWNVPKPDTNHKNFYLAYLDFTALPNVSALWPPQYWILLIDYFSEHELMVFAKDLRAARHRWGATHGMPGANQTPMSILKQISPQTASSIRAVVEALHMRPLNANGDDAIVPVAAPTAP